MEGEVVTVRIMGKREEDLKAVARVLLDFFCDRAFASPVFPNQREAGFRMYVNISSPSWRDGRRVDRKH